MPEPEIRFWDKCTLGRDPYWYCISASALRETLAQFEQAEALRELVLIFDTSKGKRGAYGGLGHDTREAQEAARSTQASRARSPRSLRL